MRKLEPRVFDQLLAWLFASLPRGGCALIGGETAQMPGMYRKGEYDLAGCIVGVVDRAEDDRWHRNIRTGDVILGLAFERPAHQRLLPRPRNPFRENAAQAVLQDDPASSTR